MDNSDITMINNQKNKCDCNDDLNKIFHYLLYEEHMSDPYKKKMKNLFLKIITAFFENLKTYKEGCECSICLNKINKITFFKTNCNHNFHLKCIVKWRQINNTCPICRGLFCNCSICSIFKNKESLLFFTEEEQ